MEIFNQLLETDPNDILLVLIVTFFVMEMAFSRPIYFGGKLKHLFQNFLY